MKRSQLSNFIWFPCIQISNTVEPQYSAHDWEISKSMLYQSVHYIEVLYNITLKLNLNHSRYTIYVLDLYNINTTENNKNVF